MLTVHNILLKKTHIIMKYLCFIVVILLVQHGFSKDISILDQIRGLEQKVKKLEKENVELKNVQETYINEFDEFKSKIEKQTIKLKPRKAKTRSIFLEDSRKVYVVISICIEKLVLIEVKLRDNMT